ncbi:MAG: parB-like partition protein [Arthrobacter sp.]|nr:parB-like partition protein [Arthrobacter sp.]
MPNDDLFPFSAQQAPRPIISIKPKARLPEATRASLRAAIAQPGEALRLRLADIDEDPHQPRTVFDAAELQSMADSIRTHGVVQPIVVRSPVNGRYLLAFGARRLRASRLAEVPDIPAVIRQAGSGDFAEQLVENQQRADLSNTDLAAAIARLVGEGASTKDIAALCALKDYQVAAFRQAGNFPPELACRLDTSDMRALYDLYRQWGKTPAEVVAALPEPGVFISVTEARRIIGVITGRPTGSIVLERARAEVFQERRPALPGGEPGTAPPVREPSPEKPIPSIEEPAASKDLPVQARSKAAPGIVQAPRVGTPVFHVAAGDGRSGQLVVDRRARGKGLVLVAYPTGIEEVQATQLRFMRVD